jgi:AcrR family transcriptional regulator
MNQPLTPLMLKALVPATARGEATRRKLLAAAEVEFGARGFHAASVSSITTRADVGQGTFYLYFHSKEEIFITLVREIGRALRTFAAKAGAAAPTRRAGEREGLVALLRYTLDYPGRYRIVQESQFVDETVFREYHERLARSYAQSLIEGTESGNFKQGDADTRAWAILGIGQLLALRYCLWTGRMPPEEVIDSAMDMIESGIMAPNPLSTPVRVAA